MRVKCTALVEQNQKTKNQKPNLAQANQKRLRSLETCSQARLVTSSPLITTINVPLSVFVFVFVFQLRAQECSSHGTEDTMTSHLVAAKVSCCSSAQSTHQAAIALLLDGRIGGAVCTGLVLRGVRVRVGAIRCLIVCALLGELATGRSGVVLLLVVWVVRRLLLAIAGAERFVLAFGYFCLLLRDPWLTTAVDAAGFDHRDIQNRLVPGRAGIRHEPVVRSLVVAAERMGRRNLHPAVVDTGLAVADRRAVAGIDHSPGPEAQASGRTDPGCTGCIGCRGPTLRLIC